MEVRKLCLKVAESLLDTENCFSMYRMADFSTLPQLRHACLLTILQNFTQAVEADSSAFCNLQYNQLSQVIENDHVEVRILWHAAESSMPKPAFPAELEWREQKLPMHKESCVSGFK